MNRGTMPTAPDTQPHLPTALFLCIHNAGRSQMALGWFKHLAGNRARVFSGGSEPTAQVNPAAIAVMNEIGIDIAHEQPRRWSDADLEAADVVITMGWPIDDPAGLPVDAVRVVRDEIRRRVMSLLSEFGIAAA